MKAIKTLSFILSVFMFFGVAHRNSAQYFVLDESTGLLWYVWSDERPSDDSCHDEDSYGEGSYDEGDDWLV